MTMGSLKDNRSFIYAGRLKDSVDGSVLREWSAYFMGGATTNDYNQPFCAPDDWWKHLDGVVGDLLITARVDEVLADDMKAFADKIQVSIS